jgi:enterochelin esterase-like enzyme
MIEEYEAFLKAKQIPFEAKTFDGGHRMDRSTLQLLAG